MLNPEMQNQNIFDEIKTPPEPKIYVKLYFINSSKLSTRVDFIKLTEILKLWLNLKNLRNFNLK